MPAFLINSANMVVSGSSGNDIFSLESGAQKPTLGGNGGDDVFRVFRGGVQSGFNFGQAVINGNEGNDTINGEFHTGVDYVGNFFGGGQGNDKLVFTAQTATSASFVGNTLHGGQGNDTIKLDVSGVDVFGLTINGNAGSDAIVVSASALNGAFSNVFLAGGGDNDQVYLQVNNTGSYNITLNGGDGSDRLVANFTETAQDIYINGGTYNTIDSQDGDDNIIVSSETLASATIQGNAGDDFIYVSVNQSAIDTLINGNAGNDTIWFSCDDGTENVTIAGGAGNDWILVQGSADNFRNGSNYIMGGAGDDTVQFKSATHGFSGSAQLVIELGGGADLFFAGSANMKYVNQAGTAFGSASFISAAVFSYGSMSDSKLGAMDTIVVGSGDDGGDGNFTMILPSDVTVNTFNGNAGGYYFTAGILAFDTGVATGGNIRLSQIVGTLDATLDEGEAVAFKLDQSAKAGYVFVKGDRQDDILVEFLNIETGDAMSAGAASLKNAVGNAILLELDP